MRTNSIEQLEQYRENICACCPGSLWGAKSICRVHQRSIGEIEQCPEWSTVRESAAPYRLQRQGNAIRTEQMEQVEQELKDYPWMVREIDRLRLDLEQTGTGLTGAYGVDGAMPKAKGGYTDHVQREVQRREKQQARLRQLEAVVARLDASAERLEDTRLRTVLACLMAGQRMIQIAQHIGVSRQRLHELKLELLRYLAEGVGATS